MREELSVQQERLLEAKKRSLSSSVPEQKHCQLTLQQHAQVLCSQVQELQGEVRKGTVSVKEVVASIAGTPAIQVPLDTSGFPSMVATLSALLWFFMSWSVLSEKISSRLLEETCVTVTGPFCTTCTLG